MAGRGRRYFLLHMDGRRATKLRYDLIESKDEVLRFRRGGREGIFDANGREKKNRKR